MSTLELRNIMLTYRLQGQNVPVLRGLDLHVRQGEMVAILGPSGSGKSTLLYILGCMLKPTSGDYLLDGREVTHLRETEQADLRNRHFGFIFQQFHLLPRADLVQNLLLGTRYNRHDSRTQEQLVGDAKELLHQVGLSQHLEHRPHQLSGGQQQRVAIARALMNNPTVLLADEPTGNLDSKSSAQVLDLLRSINRQGKTVVIITHDQKVADRCDRTVTVLDGKIVAGENFRPSSDIPGEKIQTSSSSPFASSPASRLRLKEDAETAWQNLWRNKSRSLLTMLGVIIGVAAVLSTVTLGSFTREKILQSYESLGVNRLVIRAYPNWTLQAKDAVGVVYDGVDDKSDIEPMRRLFPEIMRISPVTQGWSQSAQFGGKTFDQPRTLGVGEEYFPITNRHVVLGRPFSNYHVKNRSPVCVIGHEIAQKLFTQRSPLNQILQINDQNEVRFSCRIIGVLESQTSNNEWFTPDKQILLPYTYSALVANRWNARPYELNLTMRPGSSVEDLGEKIKQFMRMKYGRSVQVRVDSDANLVAQMRKFLGLFTSLLTGVALISLAVGGIGITNMMLVSVSERFKEIGLRKALGARDEEIRTQFLIESVILCGIAGLVGVVMGISGYHLILFLGSKLFAQLKFEWVFNFSSIILSFICIVAVGLLSGLVPALRAQKLQVVEALKSE